VLTPPDTGEIRNVTETMRTQVLQARPVPVGATVQVGPDTLRARGTFSVKQTDFGIKPVGGAVKVADRVTFDFDAVGVREPAR